MKEHININDIFQGSNKSILMSVTPKERGKIILKVITDLWNQYMELNKSSHDVAPNYIEKTVEKQHLLDEHDKYHYCDEKTFDNVKLATFSEAHSTRHQIFFLETSASPKLALNPKQACSVESAAKKSNLDVKLLVLSQYIDLKDNVTCYLFFNRNVSIYYLNINDIIQNSPTTPQLVQRINNSPLYRKNHMSDLLRCAFIYKYGGFYCDLDVIVIKSIKDIKNATAIINGAGHVPSGIFHLGRGHGIAREYLKLLETQYRSDVYEANGPRLFTKAILTHLKVERLEDIKASDTFRILPDMT